jgi:uncharacterized protein YkwD
MLQTLRAASLSAIALAVCAGPATAADRLDRAVLAEINFARTQPADYALSLRNGDDEAGYVDREPAARDEAIEFLERQPPLPPLAPNANLALAATEQVAAQGPRGQTGHAGADGSSPADRIHRRGVWRSRSAETISYGYGDAAAVVRQLIIDAGVPGRGHRTILFDPNLTIAGAHCGPHAIYRYMCVIDFAGAPLR